MCAAYLCSLDTSSPWFAGAANTLLWLYFAMVVLADASRPCFARSGGYFATLATPALADALPLWLHYLLVVSNRCFAAVVLLLLVDT